MGRIAAIDFGTVRIGVALADEKVKIASPHAVYQRRDPAADAAYFRDLAKAEQIERFVVGLPVHLDGHESGKSTEARAFAAWLAKATGVLVVLFDERFTTAEAEQHLIAAGLTSKERKKRLDKLAAQILLTAYLEAPERAAEAPRGLDD